MNAAIFGSARAASSNLNALAELLRQAVVEVRSGDTGSGTGIIWGGAGLVVTNGHCIKRGEQLQVENGGKRREGHELAYQDRKRVVKGKRVDIGSGQIIIHQR